MTLEILDAGGTAVRSLSSDDPVLEPDPALDPEGYDRICRQDPTAPNCPVPLYWPAPQMVLSTMSAAMSMQEADVAPTARQVAACDAAREQFREVMRRWNELRTRAGED